MISYNLQYPQMRAECVLCFYSMYVMNFTCSHLNLLILSQQQAVLHDEQLIILLTLKRYVEYVN